MGPEECGTPSEPVDTASSVFTTLYQYADIIAHTIDNKEGAIKMHLINNADRLIPHCAIVLFLLFFNAGFFSTNFV